MAQCIATSKRSGDQCKRAAVPGATVCKMHGGGAPQVRAAAAKRLVFAAARAEMDAERGRLGYAIEGDEMELMLELVYEAAGNVAALRQLVQELEAGVGRGAIAGEAGSTSKVNEALPHIFVVMYNDERDRLARYLKMAHDMGIDERRVQLAEEHGRLIADVLRTSLQGFVAALIAAGLTVDVVRRVYREAMPSLVRGALEAVSTQRRGLLPGEVV
jgi:hypothetical protein